MIRQFEIVEAGLTGNIFHDLRNHFSLSYTRRILIEALDLLSLLWPYLVAGIILTSLIKMFLTRNQVSEFFHSRKDASIFVAAFIGIISPLGSYVVIPLAAAMFLIGTPIPILMAFLVSSPLIDPNLFILTAGAFGYEMAVARTIAAFILGVTAGYSTLLLLKIRFLNPDKVVNDEFNKPVFAAGQHTGKADFMRNYAKELFKMASYISKFFFLAVLLAAAVKILTPPHLMIRLFNGNTFMSVLFSTGAGIPFYTCGGAAIPVVKELADFGMSNGAILAFFISGPVTKISNLVLMQSAFNFRIFLIYLLVGIIGAILLGLIYNFY